MRTFLVGAGLVLYLVSGVFPYLGSFLVAPPAGVAFLYAGWTLGLVPTLMLARRRSMMVLAAMPAAIAFWLIVLTIGERLYGWTA
ncbi:MAG: hypothetical protein EPO16_11450 [Dehalococcoidia bacterium]|nr:MAG: hypothetical protein EPO16_11450 [Dehalococcoidia bacterium]